MFECRFSLIPQTFVVVGCGGTGSRLIPLLAQFLKTCQWILNPVIHLVDDDVVEEKNLARQNFISTDVGKPKAAVLATRYGKAYNIPIVAITKRVSRYGKEGAGQVFNDIFSQEALVPGNKNAAMIISCVDSMDARHAILDEFSSLFLAGSIFLDGGNEDIFGQVMISNPRTFLARNVSHGAGGESKHKDCLAQCYPKLANQVPVSHTVNEIPFNLKFYNQASDGVSTRSCADLDQTMAINSLVAITMFGLIQNILFSRTINTPRINVTLSGCFPEYLTPHYIWGISLNESSNLIPDLAAKESVYNNINCSKVPRLAQRLKSLYLSDYLYPLERAMQKIELDKRKKAEQEEAARMEAVAKADAERRREAERAAAELRRQAEERAAMSALSVTPLDEMVSIAGEPIVQPSRRGRRPTRLEPVPPAPPQRLEIPPGFVPMGGS